MHLVMIFLTGTESQARRHTEPTKKALRTHHPVHDSGQAASVSTCLILCCIIVTSALFFEPMRMAVTKGCGNYLVHPHFSSNLQRVIVPRGCVFVLTVGKHLPRIYKNLRSLSRTPSSWACVVVNIVNLTRSQLPKRQMLGTLEGLFKLG